jgi:putative tryptophan/tyrosine transport system substrate-binding protein
MRRREFITLPSGAAVMGSLARAQPPTIPVVGLLSALSIDDRSRVVEAFQKGLSDVGYVEGRNVALEYRFAEGQYNLLPALAADLVRRNVAVLAALSGTPAALAAKTATSEIPIVFAIGGDPVASGLEPASTDPKKTSLA